MEDLSYSMFFDKKKNNIPFSQIESRKVYRWVDDNAVISCYTCKFRFSFYTRKHHCRVCGRIFCYQCSSNKIVVPESLQINPSSLQKSEKNKEDNFLVGSPTNSYFLQSYLKQNIRPDKVRVCDGCSKKIQEVNRLKNLIKIFDIIEIDILDLLNIRMVCKVWRQLANFYLSKIREIQYYLIDHNYTNFDKKILWTNRKYFVGHSLWLVQLLRSIDYEDYHSKINKLEEIIDLIYRNTRKIDCKKLMCTRLCNIELSPENGLSLLDRSIKSKEIKIFALKYLNKATIEELVCYIPFHLQLRHHY